MFDLPRPLAFFIVSASVGSVIATLGWAFDPYGSFFAFLAVAFWSAACAQGATSNLSLVDAARAVARPCAEAVVILALATFALAPQGLLWITLPLAAVLFASVPLRLAPKPLMRPPMVALAAAALSWSIGTAIAIMIAISTFLLLGVPPLLPWALLVGCILSLPAFASALLVKGLVP